MSGILLLGSPHHAAEVSVAIAPDQQLFLWNDGFSPDGNAPTNERLVLVESTSQLPDNLSAIIELSCVDDGQKHSNLGFIAHIAGPDTIVLSNTLTMTATAAAALVGGTLPVVGFSFLPSTFASASLVEVAPSLQMDKPLRERTLATIRGLFTREVEVVADCIGLVSARVVAMVINEAAFAMMEGVASPADIDTAMKLGTNYPDGPLHWADRIGPDVVLSILDALWQEYREERYRPCVLLRQLARANKPFHA
ncbi:MAG: 3-hydroxybutyryl-CoA dehydrogenase [Armatimonadetes bacterium]|nr:3-hydroxybutyryl-CoA dehydrogenase [Armatimonadota bacterium]